MHPSISPLLFSTILLVVTLKASSSFPTESISSISAKVLNFPSRIALTHAFYNITANAFKAKSNATLLIIDGSNANSTYTNTTVINTALTPPTVLKRITSLVDKSRNTTTTTLSITNTTATTTASPSLPPQLQSKSRPKPTPKQILKSLIRKTTYNRRNNLPYNSKSTLSWINGIAHTHNDMLTMSTEINEMFGCKVSICYNPTSMVGSHDRYGYIKDLSQATSHHFGRITEEVDALVLHLKNECKKVGSEGRVVHIAHSQGAVITMLAARMLRFEEQNKIEVVTFGGAAAVTGKEFPGFRRRVHYYSLNDPLLNVVTPALKALTSGNLGVSRVNTYKNKDYDTEGEHEPEFIFLTPSANDPIVDHGLLGPTYRDILKYEGERFQLTLPRHHKVCKTYFMPGVLVFIRFVLVLSEVWEMVWKSVGDIVRRLLLKFAGVIASVLREIEAAKASIVMLARAVFEADRVADLK